MLLSMLALLETVIFNFIIIIINNNNNFITYRALFTGTDQWRFTIKKY